MSSLKMASTGTDSLPVSSMSSASTVSKVSDLCHVIHIVKFYRPAWFKKIEFKLKSSWEQSVLFVCYADKVSNIQDCFKKTLSSQSSRSAHMDELIPFLGPLPSACRSLSLWLFYGLMCPLQPRMLCLGHCSVVAWVVACPRLVCKYGRLNWRLDGSFCFFVFVWSFAKPTNQPKEIAEGGVCTRQPVDDVLRSIIHSCSRKAMLKCKTDPYKFWNWEFAPCASVVLERRSKLSRFQLCIMG